MTPRDLRVLLSPESSGDEIVVSRKKVADLQRKAEELDLAKKEIEELRNERQKLREENRRLREKLAQVGNSLPVVGADPRTAAAAGVPTSKTFYPRPRSSPEEKRKPGGQPGHPGVTRPRPTPNAPPRHLVLRTCPKCGASLGKPCDEWRHTITHLPPWFLEIYDLVVKRYKCPGCKARVHAAIPEAHRGDFGPRLKALVAQLRALGLSFGQIVEFFVATFRLELSEGTLHTMEEGVAQSMDGTCRELWEELHDAQRTPHAEGDETGMPVNGKTEQVWVGVSPTVSLYFTQHESQVEKGARSKDAAARTWAGYTGPLTHDGLASYHGVDEAVVHQWCLVHLNRELQKVEAAHGIEVRGFLEEKPPKFTRAGRPPREFLKFAAGVRARLRKEVRWVEEHPNATARRRQRRYYRAVRSMARFLARRWRDEDAVRIAGTMKKGLETIFTFVRIPGVPYTSNGAERELKVPVRVRKTQGGRKTERGTWVMDRILTVWRACRRRGLPFLDVVTTRLMWAGSESWPPLPRPTG